MLFNFEPLAMLLLETEPENTFARRFLKTMGWNTCQMRVEKAPCAKGSAEQWGRPLLVPLNQCLEP